MYRIYADDKLLHDPNLVTEGYGVLSPKLTLEINKAGSLEFVMPPNHKLYNELSKLKTELVVYDDDEILFKGRVLNDEKDFYNQKKVYVEGRLAYLLDSVLRPYTLSSLGEYLDNPVHKPTLNRWLEYYLDCHDDSTKRGPKSKYFDYLVNHKKYDYTLTGSGPNGYYNENEQYLGIKNVEHSVTFDEINDKLVEPHGGYLIMRYSGEIDLGYNGEGVHISHTFSDTLCWETEDKAPKSDQIIEFGVNMLDITEHISGEDIFTALIPVGGSPDGSETKITIQGHGTNGSDYLEDTDMKNLFGVIELVAEWPDITDIEELKNTAQEFLNNNKIQLKTTINLKAIDLHLINVDIKRIHLGDMVRVVSVPHGIDTELQCSKIVYDLVNPDQNEYVFGHNLETLTEKQVKSQKNKNNYSATVGQTAGVSTLSLVNESSGTVNNATSSEGGTE